MQNKCFPLTSTEVRQRLGLKYHTLYRSYRRTGGYRGVKPVELPSGELLWPRAEILKLAPKQLDMAAFLSILTERGLRTNDVAYAIGAALLDPELPSDRPQENLACMVSYDWSVFTRQLVEAYASHVRRVWPTLNDDDRAQLRSQLLGTDWQEGLVGLVRSLEALTHV